MPVTLTGANVAWDIKVEMQGSSDLIIVATNAGIHTSSDSGTTFKLTYAGGTVNSLALSSAGWIAFSVANGLIVSSDLGQTWAPFGNWATVATPNPIRAAIDVHGDTVYILATNIDRKTQRDIFKSM